MTPGNWCADFVNGALASANIKGIQGSIATSFRKWGIPVTDGVKAGDVVVTHRGLAAGQTGGHVGLATGNTRMKNGRLQYETISGNYSKKVGTGWEYQDRVEVRRAVEDAQALQRRAAEINKPTTAGRGPADEGPVSAPVRDQWGNQLGQSTPTRTGSGGLGQSTPTRNGPGGRNGDAGSGGSGFNIHGPIHINVPGAGDPKAVASAVNQEIRSRVMARAHDIDPTAV